MWNDDTGFDGLRFWIGTGNSNLGDARDADLGHRCNESVSSAGHRLYEDWILRIVFQDLANLSDCGIDAVVGVKEDVLAPDPGENIVSTDQLPLSLDQQEQDLHGDSFQLQSPAGATEFKADPV
jgi:hypothetical protein